MTYRIERPDFDSIQQRDGTTTQYLTVPVCDRDGRRIGHIEVHTPAGDEGQLYDLYDWLRVACNRP
jgi:hypothetical protein